MPSSPLCPILKYTSTPHQLPLHPSISISTTTTTQTHPAPPGFPPEPTATILTSILSPFRTASRAFCSSRRNLSPAIMSAAKVKAQQIIDENAVVVFSKSYCPYCRATKSLLNDKHAKYFLMELDQVGKS